MSKLITIQVGVTEQQLADLDLIAGLRGVSRAWIIRALLDEYEEKLYKAAKRLEKGGDLI